MIDFSRIPLLDTARWVPVVHLGCGEKAFEINATYITRKTRQLRSAYVRMPNGQRPEYDSPVVCGSCGAGVCTQDLKPSDILTAAEYGTHVKVA